MDWGRLGSDVITLAGLMLTVYVTTWTHYRQIRIRRAILWAAWICTILACVLWIARDVTTT